MAVRTFDATVQLDGTYIASRSIKGEEMHATWNVENMNTSLRTEWGLDANKDIQYRSAVGTYSLRYNTNDIPLTDCQFETDIQPTGPGNYEVGLAFRFKSRSSFYYMTFNGGYQDWGGKNIRLMKMNGSTPIKLADYDHPVFVPATTYHFKVTVTGGRIVIELNGAVIIDFTDSNPITNGAFGPMVYAQEFAKWKNFVAISVNPFSLQKSLTGNEVDPTYYDAASAKLLSAASVGQFMQPSVDAMLQNISYSNLVYTRFSIASNNTRVKVLFDKTFAKTTTTGADSLMYAYQEVPTSAPLAVTSFFGTALSASSIKWEWLHADDSEDGFYVLDEAGLIVGTVGENVLSFTETGLTEGTTYKRRVTAYNVAGRSAESTQAVVTTQLTPPLAPSDMKGEAISSSSIKWSWTDNSSNEAVFEVMKYNDQGIPVILATVGAGVTEYIETGLIPEREYTRFVRAKNSAAVSAGSNNATVETLRDLPDAPPLAPHNFFGVGTAADTIVWSWEDENINVTGYALIDSLGNVIARIPKGTTMYEETGLYSKMAYRRKVLAYNEGGNGPATEIATAYTLGYGYDYSGLPVAPKNLYILQVGSTDVKLEWDYDNHEQMPAVGFKVYNDLELLIDVIPLEMTYRTISGLTPDSTYRFHVVAYNENGDSLPTNEVTVVTLSGDDGDDDEEEPVEPYIPLDDPMYGITYDKEEESTPKIRAFQSGIGDNLDLMVRASGTEIPILESFTCEVYIKALYMVDTDVKEWSSIPASVSGTVKKGETLPLLVRIQSPKLQPSWKEIEEKYKFVPGSYKLVINTSNPNVSVVLERPIQSFLPVESTFVNAALKARIINHTQTAWNPHIHNGYYYLNQREHFLFSESDVKPYEQESEQKYTYAFPYAIRAYGDHSIAGEKFTLEDDTLAKFLLGSFTNTKTDAESNAVVLADKGKGEYVSRLFSFGRPVDVWGVIDVDVEGDKNPIVIEAGAADESGAVATWTKQTNHAALNLPDDTRQMKYRIKMEDWYQKEDYVQDVLLSESDLMKGKGTNFSITYGKVSILSPELQGDATYLTAPIDYGTKVTSLGTIEIAEYIPFGAKIILYSVTSDNIAHNASEPTTESPWIPLEFVSKADGVATYKIKSATKRYLTIVAKLYSYHEKIPGFNRWDEFHHDSSSFNTYLPYSKNIQLEGEYMGVKDPSLGSAEYISSPIRYEYVSDITAAYKLYTRNASGEMPTTYFIWGETKEEVEAKVARSEWTQIRPDAGAPITYRPFCYFAYRLLIPVGTKTTGAIYYIHMRSDGSDKYYSPSISNLMLHQTLYREQSISPKIKSVKFTAETEESTGGTQYIVPMEANINSDATWQFITMNPLKDVVREYLKSQYIPNAETMPLRDFLVECDNTYPVEFRYDTSGITKLETRTKTPIGELIWVKKGIFFDKETRSARITPIPESGTPLVVRNATGKLLRQVHFRDSTLGLPSLTNMEELYTDESRYLFLEHYGLDVPNTKVFVQANEDGSWTEIFNFTVVENRIVLPSKFLPGTKARVIYRLLDSYCIDYNADVNKEYALIKVLTDFNPNDEATRHLSIMYETNHEHAYYLAEEVDLNPLHTKIHTGFLYLTDEIFDPRTLEIEMNPRWLYSDIEDKAVINVFVKDMYGNPVVGEKVTIAVTSGKLTVREGISDMNGMISSVYTSPLGRVETDTVTASVVGRKTSTHLSKSLVIHLIYPEPIDKITIVPEKRVVNKSGVVQLKVIALGASNEPITNRRITMSVNKGTLSASAALTNTNGEATFTYKAPSSSSSPYVMLTAKTMLTNNTEITEQNILYISGV